MSNADKTSSANLKWDHLQLDRFVKESKGSNMALFLDENDSVLSYFVKNGSFVSIRITNTTIAAGQA